MITKMNTAPKANTKATTTITAVTPTITHILVPSSPDLLEIIVVCDCIVVRLATVHVAFMNCDPMEQQSRTTCSSPKDLISEAVIVSERNPNCARPPRSDTGLRARNAREPGPPVWKTFYK